ncbi:hypothetical protein PCLA_01f0441 [Pseudomonas citronellolis]|nr:hypothetical protein PCLA_01f0441 [Pseudomonas citronellolis]
MPGNLSRSRGGVGRVFPARGDFIGVGRRSVSRALSFAPYFPSSFPRTREPRDFLG